MATSTMAAEMARARRAGVRETPGPSVDLDQAVRAFLKALGASPALVDGWLPPAAGSWDFLRALRDDDHDRILKHYTAVQKAALNEASATQGGYLIPVEYSTAMLHAVAENSFIRPRALIVPMTAKQTNCPRLRAEPAQAAGVSPFYAGIAAGWGTSEGASLSETEPTFGNGELVVRDLFVEMIVSNQWLDDIGEAGEQALVNILGRAVAWYEEYAFINGSGTDRPLGLLKSPTALPVTRAVASQVAIADIAGMAAKLTPYAWNHSVWACSPSTLAQVMKVVGYQPNAGITERADGFAGTLMSRPLFSTEKLPVLGATGDLILFDPAEYVIGDRQMTVIEASRHPRFRNNQTVFRVWHRVDGQPLLADNVTLADATSTASSIVVLAAP